MKIRIWAGTAALLGTALALPAPAVAVEYKEVHTYGIANFGGAGQCGSSGQTHTVHTATAAGFLDNFQTLQGSGDWDEALSRDNSLARGSYFTDSTKATSCACTADDSAGDYGADAADVIYVHTHGGRSTSSPYYTSLLMGNSSYDCKARTNDNMLFGEPSGNGDLGFAVIKACQSGDYNVWQNGGYRQQLTTTDSSFRMWNAFHGDSSCGSHVTTYVTSYAAGSNYSGIGENWLDEAYDDDAGADNDDCPVSIIMGASSTQREDLFENGGWLDRKATGDKTGSTIFYIGGCDPSNGIVLPN